MPHTFRRFVLLNLTDGTCWLSIAPNKSTTALQNAHYFLEFRGSWTFQSTTEHKAAVHCCCQRRPQCRSCSEESWEGRVAAWREGWVYCGSQFWGVVQMAEKVWSGKYKAADHWASLLETPESNERWVSGSLFPVCAALQVFSTLTDLI